MRHLTYRRMLFVVALGWFLGGSYSLSGQDAPSFLEIGMDSRTAAMGGSQLAGTGTAMTLFTNPAGLGSLQHLQASTTVTDWFLDIRHFGGALAVPVDGMGTFGLSTVWMDYGAFDRTVPALGSVEGYTTEGTFQVAEYAVGLAYARPVTPHLQLGGQL